MGDNCTRTACAGCGRPHAACYCSALPATPLSTRATRVLVLQSAREQRRRAALSSVPVLSRVLPESVSVVRVDDDADCSPGVDPQLDALLYGGHADFDAALVLFPDPTALPIGGEGVLELDDKRQTKVLLVVLDGTWTEAKKMVHRNREHWAAAAAASWKGRLRYVCLADTGGEGGSIYGDLRREPMEGCVSTLEAVAAALKALEPPETREQVHDALLTAFRGMVAVQTAFQQQGKAEAERRHGGVSKQAAIAAKAEARAAAATTARQVTEAASSGVPGRFVLFETRTDLLQRKQLVQQGETMECTYDEARNMCRALNEGRKRGSRLAVLPLEAFQRQQSE